MWIGCRRHYSGYPPGNETPDGLWKFRKLILGAALAGAASQARASNNQLRGPAYFGRAPCATATIHQSTTFQNGSRLDRLRNLVTVSAPLAEQLSGELGYMNQHRFVCGGSDISDNVAYFGIALSL